MALAPALYTFYTVLLTYRTYKNRIQGYVPDYVPLWAIIVLGYVIFPTITYAALRFGEIGMDIVKSLRPLFIALSPAHGSMLVRLQERRAALSAQVTDLINTLGPEMFPDFDSARIVADPFHDGEKSPTSPSLTMPSKRRSRQDSSASYGFPSEPSTPTSPQHITFSSATPDSYINGPTSGHNLPRNESFKSLSNIGLFASRPTTPHHVRSRSRTNSAGGFPIQGFSSLDYKESLEEVSKKIRGAMRERTKRRRSETERAAGVGGGYDGYGSGNSTAGSDDEGDGLRMTTKKDI
jgi:glycerol-3-phosphate O-acyltransferase/dihydroxyacetone phosphate acyltransferase